MLVFTLSPEHVPEKVLRKGMGQGMWERQGLNKNIAWFPATPPTLVAETVVSAVPYKFLLTPYWWLEGVQALLTLNSVGKS